MNAQNLRIPWNCFLSSSAMILAVFLAGCVAPTSTVSSPAESGDSAGVNVGGSAGDTAGGTADNNAKSVDITAGSRDSRAANSRPQRKLCDRPEASLSPLSTPDDAPIFEQFNFQPQRIASSSKGVEANTTYHTFSYCANTGEWTISNRPSPSEPPFDYSQYIQELADPDYETLQVGNRSYDYRVRLEASWIDRQLEEQLKEQLEQAEPSADIADASPNSLPSEVTSGEATEDAPEDAPEEAVYFDLKLPNGTVTTHQLYTLTDVQEASIGASLGVPSIANVIEVEDALWFAATTSQGEGENGLASLVRYDLKSSELEVHQPPEIQGDQITTLAATSVAKDEAPVLWLGTLRSAEGTPFFPASGLISYQPTSESDGILRQYTIDNSPMVGAIPYQLASTNKDLWVATGSGICKTQWLTIEQDSSWRCWQFIATAALPSEGVDLYPSFLAQEPAAKLTGPNVEVLWANWEHFDQPDVDKAGAFRYEVAYPKGFEADLAQGGHRLDNAVAQRMARGNDIFWPGQHWHWSGQRFERSLDEVSLNLLGGGPYGLIASNIQTGLSFDHYAIRGDFDLLSLKPDGTQVRYYSGWVEGDDLKVYPDIVEVEQSDSVKPNPITSIATDLPPVGP